MGQRSQDQEPEKDPRREALIRAYKGNGNNPRRHNFKRSHSNQRNKGPMPKKNNTGRRQHGHDVILQLNICGKHMQCA